MEAGTADAEHQYEKLRYFDCEKLAGDATPAQHQEDEAADSGSEFGSVPPGGTSAGGATTPVPPSRASVGRALSSSESDTDVAEHVPIGKYVVSLGTKKGIRRLHFTGSCGLRPGIDFQKYKVLGDEGPGPGDYDQVCKLCWPGGLALNDSEKEDGPSSSSSDSPGSAEGEGLTPAAL